MKRSSLTAGTGIALLLALAIFKHRTSPHSGSNSPAKPADSLAQPRSGEHAARPALPVGGLSGEIRETRCDFAKVVAFNDWAESWKGAAPEARKEMEVEGLRLAKERRPEFKKLIRTDPQRALERAVPRVIRQDLPAAIVAQLEEPVSAKGNYKVYMGRPQEGVELPEDTELALRYFETGEKSYLARVFGRMTPVMSKADLPLRGVALDREFAVAESPVRQLETGERVPAGTPIEANCPVSGKVTPIETLEEPVDEETPAVEVAGRVILLCNGTHVTVYDESYTNGIMASGPGGAGFFQDNHPGTSSEAIGNFRCLYIRVTYPDQMRAPNSEYAAYGDMRNVSRFYLESSYGRLTTTSSVTPLIVLPHTQAWYIAKDSEVDGLGLVHSDARSEARRLGYDSNQFNCTIVRVNGGPRLSGISWGGGDSVWVSWDGMDVLNHECGHSLGRNHANYWNTSDGSAIGVGSNAEYGNSYDVMGGGGGFGAHYNVISKRSLGWLSDPYVHRPVSSASANGVYRLYAYDQPQLEEGKRYAFRIDKDVQRRFNLEYHPAIGGARTDSVLMILSGLGSNAGHLVDTTPGTPGGKGDGGIQIGRTFSDYESDMHFTVLGKNTETPPSMDVQFLRGPFPGNRAPVISSLTASATSVAVNGSVTFTAAATDADGDALAYNWDFSDGYVSENSATLTRSFNTTDQLTVCLTVSDMKGGYARAHEVITVGSPGRGVVRGRITDGGQPVMGALVVSDTDKYAYTDTNGNYAVADLSAGSRTFTASLTGYTFAENFTNPMTVVAGTNAAADWTATSLPAITLAATDGAEGGAAGTFTLTRSGDTSAALAVNVAPVTGSATLTTDFTLSPNYADNGVLRTFTIPAGQASLAVNVNPVNDTAQEGPETVSLQLAAGTGYAVRQSGIVTLTIADDDTTRPVVSLAATDLYATETPGDAGAFTIRRTGSTTAALSVSLTWSGTATRGTDFPNLATSISIPAGQSSVTLAVPATDDTAIEIPEDATLTVATNAGYVVDPVTNSASVTITDNDLPTVSLTVLDDTLNENNRETGAVLISRTGNLSQPLTVYYGLSGRALHGTDYVALPGQLTIPAGASSAPVILTPWDDDHGEADESITFTLSIFNNTYSLGTAYTGNLNIVDDGDAPLITVVANGPSEPSTNGTFTFQATGNVSGNITLRYTLSGTATAGADYTAPSGTVTIAGTGANTATVSIPVINDSSPEDSETIILTLTPDPAYVAYNDGTAVMRLKDDDAPYVSLTAHKNTPAEPSTGSSFYVARSNTTGEQVVNYTISGTATNGTDYASLTGSVIIADGASGADIPLTITDDTTAEGTETVTLTLAAGVGYTMDSTATTATLYITDNDSSAMASVGFKDTTSTVDETIGLRDVEVTLSAAQTVPVTAEFVVGGGTAVADDVDWTWVDTDNGNAPLTRGILTFAPGVISKMVRIRVKNDGIVEGSETAILELRNVNRARLSTSRNKHTVTITDANNPLPRVRLTVPASRRSELDGTEPMLMAVLDRAMTSAVSVAYSLSGTATQGSDYTLAPGTLTFAAGETVKLLPIQLLNDGVAELSETIVVTLASPIGAELSTPAAHTITLTDANTPVVSITAATPSLIEGGTPGSFTITRNGGTSLSLNVAYTISGTASSGADFTALAGTITMPAGQASVTIPVSVTDDTAEEPEESLTLTLSTSPDHEIGAGYATLTILDNDSPPDLSIVSPAAPAVAVPAGAGLILQAEATRVTPQGIAAQPVTWSLLSGPGTAAIESAGSAITGVRFTTEGTYVMRVVSGSGAAQATRTTTVHYGATAYPPRTVGTTTAAGSATVNASGEYTIRGAGTGISSSGTSDGFFFAPVQMTGDFDVSCRATGITNPGGSTSCRYGIMARDALTANSPYAFTLMKSDRTIAYQARLTAGAAPYSNAGGTVYDFPRYLRLKRVGNVFSSWHSADGVAWTQRGTDQTVTMSTTCWLGLAITSAVQATASTATFDTLAGFTPVVNRGALPDAGPALSGSGPWQFSGTVTDDGNPGSGVTTLWSSAAGPAVPAITDPSLLTSAVTFTASGSYTLRLTADDGEMLTYDDTTASVTASTPWQSWRSTEFTAGELTNLSVSGEAADPDQDGLSNLVEYALGLEPKTGNASPLTVGSSESALTLTYTRNLAATDTVLQIQRSNTLDSSSWQNVTPLSDNPVGTSGTVQTREAALPITGSLGFFRILATRP